MVPESMGRHQIRYHSDERDMPVVEGAHQRRIRHRVHRHNHVARMLGNQPVDALPDIGPGAGSQQVGTPVSITQPVADFPGSR